MRSAEKHPKLRQRHYVACLDCGRFIDVEDPRLNHLVAQGQPERIDLHIPLDDFLK
jgi:Fe2+ or Zn2+ uptake regulation protein